MTDLLTAALLFLAGCLGVYLIHLMKQPLPRVPPDRHQMDDDQEYVRTRVHSNNEWKEL